MNKIYDVIIIGAGPAGLSAGLYAGRANMTTLIIEKGIVGGQIVQTSEIENYPGGIEEETGQTLVDRMWKQVDKFGVEKVTDAVMDVELNDDIKTVICNNGKYQSKAVIIATGTTPMEIGCIGEKEYIGRGVSYCATCDGVFFRDLEVFVIGGGDAAVEEAIYLTKFAKKVTIIHRRDELRAAKSIQEKAFANEKVDYMWNSIVKELKGDGVLESIIVEDTKTKETREIFANKDDGMMGLFVFIGLKPQTEVFGNSINLEQGYIPTDENMKTEIQGVFAAGDIRVKSLRQVITAASDGAISATQAEKYIEKQGI